MLGLLPMRVPDPRVAISTAMSTPSETHLSSGKLEFVVFRRDLANNAPDHATLRIVAQVVRALTFVAGSAKTTKVDGSWIIRSNSYQMRVAPVANYPDMIRIMPDPSGFCFAFRAIRPGAEKYGIRLHDRWTTHRQDALHGAH